MANNFGWYFFFLVYVLAALYLTFIYPKKKFDDIVYSKNNRLLNLDREQGDQVSMHFNLLGFTLMIAGITLLSQKYFIDLYGTKSLIIVLTLIIGGMLYILLGIFHAGRAKRIYLQLRENIMNKKINKSKKALHKLIRTSQKFNRVPTNKIDWFIVISLILIAFTFFILYIIASNWITNEKLYPVNYSDFYLDIRQEHISSKCFSMDNPSIEIDYKKNVVKIYTYFEKKRYDCNEKELNSYSNPTFTISDLKELEEVDNPENLDYNYTINKTKNEIRFKINLTDIGDYTPFRFAVIVSIEPKFHTDYRISVTGASKVDKLDFNYNTHFLKGYTCDENCFTFYEGDIKQDFNIFRGFSKSWRFNNSNLFIRFSPKSNLWLFWLRVLDIFILAISAVAMYDAIFKEIFIKKIGNSNNNLSKFFKNKSKSKTFK